MENVGLITYASSLLLATPREETAAFRRRYAAFAAHELAHMWFGNLVTLAWWDDTWLNEAFASWMGDKVIERYRAEWARGWSVRYGRSYALELDRLPSARRIRNPVADKNDLSGAFDSITYMKGAAVLAMFENWFSPETFRQGVRIFLKRHALANATSEDFIRALGEASGRGAEALAVFRGFIEQPGVPLVDIALDCAGEPAALALEQQRLRPAGVSAAELAWTTPFCVRYGTWTQCADIGNGKSFLPLSQPACPSLLVANAGGRSYYVSRYARALGERVRSQADLLSANEMVGALIDVRVLAESGLAPLSEALAWADSGLAHLSPVAKLEAIELLQKQRDAWLSPADASAKREIIAKRVRPLAAAMSWNEAAAESEDERELRPRLMSFASEVDDDGELRSLARELATAWLANHDAVPATLTSAVLDTAARFADADSYARLEKAAVTTSDRRERRYLLAALGKVRAPKLRSRMLELSLKEDINGYDAAELLQAALGDDTNRRAAFDFLRANYDPIAAKLPQSALASPIVWLMRATRRAVHARGANAFRRLLQRPRDEPVRRPACLPAGARTHRHLRRRARQPMKFGVRAVIIFCALAAGAALAQNYPAHAVRFIVGFTPGGGVDINARLLAAKISELFGQQVMVENKPGAGTNIANELVAKAPPDGYTLLFNSPAVAINMSLYKNPALRRAARLRGDLDLLAEPESARRAPPRFPRAIVKELIALAREQAGRAQLLVRRPWHDAAPRRRAVQAAHRHANRARAL